MSLLLYLPSSISHTEHGIFPLLPASLPVLSFSKLSHPPHPFHGKQKRSFFLPPLSRFCFLISTPVVEFWQSRRARAFTFVILAYLSFPLNSEYFIPSGVLAGAHSFFPLLSRLLGILGQSRLGKGVASLSFTAVDPEKLRQR